MLSYEELNEKQQQAILEYCLADLLRDIAQGDMRFSDQLNEDDTQARVDKAWEAANRMHTPWFVTEFIMDDKELVSRLRSLAAGMAQQARYEVNGDMISIIGPVAQVRVK